MDPYYKRRSRSSTMTLHGNNPGSMGQGKGPLKSNIIQMKRTTCTFFTKHHGAPTVHCRLILVQMNPDQKWGSFSSFRTLPKKQLWSLDQWQGHNKPKLQQVRTTTVFVLSTTGLQLLKRGVYMLSWTQVIRGCLDPTFGPYLESN